MKIYDKIYGTFDFPDRFAVLIDSAPLQRLKNIHQNGADFLVDKRRIATRYEHSVGVMILIKRFGGTEEEQIAGLLHDVSHTVFSHTIDHVKERCNQDYHEKMKEAYLGKTNLKALVSELGFNPSKIFDEDNYQLLEKKIPDLCADRLDYFFRDLHNFELLSKEEIHMILCDLTVEKGSIKCKTEKIARIIFKKFIQLNNEIFMKEEFEVANIILSTLIRQMVKEGLLAEDDLFKNDDFVIDNLSSSRYSSLLNRIKVLTFNKCSKNKGYKYIRKLRYVDPIIIAKNKRLTEIDFKSRQELQDFLGQKMEINYDIPELDLIKQKN